MATGGGGPACKGPHSYYNLCESCESDMEKELSQFFDDKYGFEPFWDAMLEEDVDGIRDAGFHHIAFACFIKGLV